MPPQSLPASTLTSKGRVLSCVPLRLGTSSVAPRPAPSIACWPLGWASMTSSEEYYPAALVHRRARLGGHAAGDSHDERDPCVDLLLRPGLARIDIGPRVVTPDDIADAPLQDRIAVVRDPVRAHRRIQLLR